MADNDKGPLSGIKVYALPKRQDDVYASLAELPEDPFLLEKTTEPSARERAEEEIKAAREYEVNQYIDYITKVGRAFDSIESVKESIAYTPPPERSIYKQKTETNADAKTSTAKTNNSNDMLITNPNAPFSFGEAFLSLRTNVKHIAENTGCRKIIVTSAIPSEGKSSICINLALALSAANSSVGLIDADFRKPMLHNYLGIEKGTSLGLTNILRGKDDVKNCLQSYANRNNMYVIPCGEIPPNPSEILGSSRMGHFIDAMARNFDFVIIDTPPVSIVTDAAVLSQYADGVLLVVRQKVVTFGQAKRAKVQLMNVDANILGVVFNDFDTKYLDKVSDYYYDSYYAMQGYYGSAQRD